MPRVAASKPQTKTKTKTTVRRKITASVSNTKSSSSVSPIAHPSHIADIPQLTEAERELSQALEQLVAIGAVKRENCMTVEEIRRMDEEIDQELFPTDDESYQALKKKMEEESSESEESEESVEPVPTRVEALRACLLLKSYLLQWNDPYARELDAMLSSFGAKSRAMQMQDSKITDYFSRK